MTPYLISMWLAWNRNRYTCASKRIDTFLKLCAWKWRVGGYQWLGCVQLVQLTPLPEWLMLQVPCLIIIVLDANEIKLWIVQNCENQFISWQEQLRQRVGERESNSIFMLMARGKILFWRDRSRKRTRGFDLRSPLVQYASNNPYFTMNLVRVGPYLRPYHHPSPPSPHSPPRSAASIHVSLRTWHCIIRFILVLSWRGYCSSCVCSDVVIVACVFVQFRPWPCTALYPTAQQ